MQLTIFDALTDEKMRSSSGKMSPESSAQSTTPLAPSWADWSAVNPPSFQMENGQVQVWLLGHEERRHGGRWMPNSSEWLSEGGGSSCSLSEILEVGNVPTRFFLSPTACKGILRRAEKRGKDLPPSLLQALQQVAGA